jgi:hypothetical protein
MNKRDKIIYRVVTALFSILILMGAVMYFADYEMVAETFTSLGVPTYVIYPLAIAKILGIIAIWTNLSKILTHLAYGAFIVELLLAIFSHINAGDGDAFGPVVPLILVIISYVFYRRINKEVA